MSSLRISGSLLLACVWLATSSAAAQVQPASTGELALAVDALVISDAGVSISAKPASPRSAAGEKPFTRMVAGKIGIDVMAVLPPIDFTPPIWNGRGLAAGDVDRDGYQDILVGTRQGVRLFINRAGAGFDELELAIPELEKFETHVVGLVDINNDGWLDIFLTAFQAGIHYILSDQGKFTSAGLVKAPETPTMVAQAASFGDIDEDGDLDLVIGVFFLGKALEDPPAEATNKVLFNEAGGFRAVALGEEMVGDTHSILLSDFSNDGHLDLIVGNDFDPPDFYYRGDGKGAFKLIKKSDGIIPVTTHTTMSADTGDYNNDLRLDILMTQIAGQATGVVLRERLLVGYCEDIPWGAHRLACERTLKHKLLFRFFADSQPSDVLRCKQIRDAELQQQCAAMMLLQVVVREKDEALCDRMPKSQARGSFLCHALFSPHQPGSEKQYAEAIETLKNENTLLRANPDGSFENVAESTGVGRTSWSWNSKFGDFDNDGLLDIYVVNGTWARSRGTPAKFFYHNVDGSRFEEATDAFGLQNYMIQSAYLMVDVDNDGDLDTLANTINGPVWFYRNNDVSNNSILFDFRDQKSNRYCVGCKIRIYYGENASRGQLREIKSGGGYLSFDAPFAHFGLGAEASVARVEVDWSTGGTTRIEGPLPANALYTITRE